MVKDLTQGRPGRVLALFSIPSLISVVFQQLYNMADNVVAGQFLGDDALSAVSVSYPVTMIYMAVALGINIGCSVVISQLFGAKRMERMKTAVSTSLLSTSALALSLMALGLIFCRPLLELLNTPEHIMGPAAPSLRIYTCGLLFIFLYNTCTGIFTALGDTLTPLIFLIVSSLSNIGLDIVFVVKTDMGVGGLALATLICQALAAVASFLVLLLRLRRIPSGRWELFSRPLLQTISTLAVPGIFQKSFVSVGNLLVQGLVNSYEATVPGIIGGFSSATKLIYLVVYVNSAMGSAVASFTAQNIGAGRLERLSRGLRSGVLICLCVAVPALVLFCGFPEAAMAVFVPAESVDIIRCGVTYLRIVSPFIAVVSMKQCCDGILQGAGSAREFMATTFSDLVLRVGLAYLLPLAMGYLGIWWAWPIGWFLGALLSCFFYRRGKWKEVHLLERV